MKKKLSLVFIVLGILVIAFPTISEKYNNYKQEQLLKNWEENLQNLASIEEELEEDKDNTSEENPIQNELQGVLTIDKIDLKLPILEGASADNMRTSVAHIENTGSLYKDENYGIAGHRNLTYGRNFNRLEEIDPGDIMSITTEDQVFTYKVTEKLYVLPKDTWVLNNKENKKEVTLVTCHPPGISTHRLIIKAEVLD